MGSWLGQIGLVANKPRLGKKTSQGIAITTNSKS